MKKILVIGSLNMDFIFEAVRLPKVGETVLADNLTLAPGGKGANQACAAARLGADVVMLGCVGRDDFGDRLLDSLAVAGVDTGRILRSAGHPTGTAAICLDSAADNFIVVAPGANRECTLEYLRQNDDLFAACDYLLLQLEIPLDAAWHAVERAHALGKTVILNPAPVPDSIPRAILPQVDYLIPNESELTRLTHKFPDGQALTSMARSLLERGAKNLVVTLGAGGALLITADGQSIIPAFPAQAVDTTAAGDCFNAAFAVALAEEQPPREAVRFANAAASIAVTRKGAQPSLPTRSEVERILR